MTDLRTRLRALVEAWRKRTAGYTIWDDAADELAALLAAEEETPLAEHQHVFDQAHYELCRICHRTEADLSSECHHCDEAKPGTRCWWCLRLRGEAPAVAPAPREDSRDHGDPINLTPYIWPTLLNYTTPEQRDEWGIRPDASMQVNLMRFADALAQPPATGAPAPREKTPAPTKRRCLCGHGPAFHINGIGSGSIDLGACDHPRCNCSWWTEDETPKC